MESQCTSVFFAKSVKSDNQNDFECSEMVDKFELDILCEDMDMMELCKEAEAAELFDTQYDKELYEICALFENEPTTSCGVQTGLGRGELKRCADTNNSSNNNQKRPHLEEASTSGASSDKMFAWLCLLGGVLLGYILLWPRPSRARRLLAGLPSYPQLPLVGNLLQLKGDGKSLFRLLDDMSRKADEAMKPFQIWLGHIPNIVIIDPDDVRTVCNAFIEKPYYYNFGKIWLGNGLVTAPGSLWKVNVKRLAGTFSASVVESYQTVFNSQAQKLVGELKRLTGAEPVDIQHLLAFTTLESICQTALGISSILGSTVSQGYFEAFNRCLMLLVERGLNPLLHPDFIYRLTRQYKEMVANLAIVHNVSRTVLEKKRLQRVKNKTKSFSYSGKEKFQAILDLLLELGEVDPRFTEEQIQNEVDTIILGGQETTASTLFYLLLMIGSRPTVQEKLFKELLSIFGGSVRAVEPADFQRMVYCEAVILETLRLFPPLPAVMRYADRELRLKSCRVPKGTGCVINAWGAGRSKNNWGPDALEFDPERWLDGRAATNPAAFIPFSYGRRSCIGKRYAMAILKTVVAHCVRELRFTSQADRLQLKVDIALRPVAGNLILIETRT